MRAIPIAIGHSLRFEIQIPRLSHRRFLLSPFSSSSSSSSSFGDPRVSNSGFDGETEEGNSAVYRHKLKFQRPSTVPWRREWWNSASFIGSIAQPLKIFKCDSAYTVLSVGKSSQSKGGFRILLSMKGEIAKMCIDYLMVNDYIYVSGRLGTDVKPQCDGSLRLLYKVLVNEVNYVTRTHDIIPQNTQELQTVEGGSTMAEKHRDRLHLWQVFFYSPYEWWDNRKRKNSSKSPDFRHKDTGECLWLSPDDPPWVKKQLELHDTRLGERGDGESAGRRARLSHWDYDDDA